MKGMIRNKRKFYWCEYEGKTAVTDDDGYETGELQPTYSEATEMYASISSARGTSDIQLFGNFTDYDKVIIIANPEYAMDENCVLFVDKDPEYDDTTGVPLFDYVVKRVSRSLNSTAYAISRVTNS